jgi:hypothetical protein
MRFTKWSSTADIGPPELPDWFWETDRIIAAHAAVHEEIGDEVILLANISEEADAALATLEGNQLDLACGALDTEHGAVGFMLFTLLNPNREEPVLRVWDALFDIADQDTDDLYRALAKQSHWHFFIFGPGPRVLNIVEFDNVFFLDVGLDDVAKIGKESPCHDFEAAVVEAQERYDILDMFEATRPIDPEPSAA